MFALAVAEFVTISASGGGGGSFTVPEGLLVVMHRFAASAARVKAK